MLFLRRGIEATGLLSRRRVSVSLYERRRDVVNLGLGFSYFLCVGEKNEKLFFWEGPEITA